MNALTKRARRFIATVIAALIVVAGGIYIQATQPVPSSPSNKSAETIKSSKALDTLQTISVKGRAPKTNYSREQFGSGWQDWKTCTVRDKILARDLKSVQYVGDTCKVESGILDDPYTGKIITFQRGATTSQAVQIDHVVALSDAWQKGAQQLTREKREQLANDDLNLIAADGPTNQQKGAGDAATWLPKNKAFRCPYVARQIAVKSVYNLWITQAEKDAMQRTLGSCPAQQLPS